MKKWIFIAAIFLLGFWPSAAVPAQSYFFFGAAAGVFETLPTDWDTRAAKQFIKAEYITKLYEQYDFMSLSPVAALTLGFETPRFSFQTGPEFFINVNENFMLRDDASTTAAHAIVYYYYSAIMLPLVANLYFVSTPRVKVGASLGSYFAFPLGDVEKILMSGSKEIFNEDSTTLLQEISGGVRFGIVTEVALSRGALVFDVGYQRELFTGVTSMILSAAAADAGFAKVENPERKITIMSGARITIGYKFRIQTAGAASPRTASEESSATAAAPLVSGDGRYYLIVAGQVEGPFTISDLSNLGAKKLLVHDSLIWKKGLVDWAKAETFSELAPIFAPAPAAPRERAAP